jgi:hypothetical protein
MGISSTSVRGPTHSLAHQDVPRSDDVDCRASSSCIRAAPLITRHGARRQAGRTAPHHLARPSGSHESGGAQDAERPACEIGYTSTRSPMSCLAHALRSRGQRQRLRRTAHDVVVQRGPNERRCSAPMSPAVDQPDYAAQEREDAATRWGPRCIRRRHGGHQVHAGSRSGIRCSSSDCRKPVRSC